MLAAPVASRCVRSGMPSLRRGDAASRPRRRAAASGSRRRGRCGCRRAERRAMSAGAAMPLSPTMMRSAGMSGASASLTASDTSKVRRLRLLMPMRRVPSGKAPLELCPVVDLDEHVHLEAVGGLDERLRLGIGNARHDDEDAICAPCPRLVDLVGLEQKVLAQRRQARCGARRVEIFGPTLKRRPVGEDREAGRAALLHRRGRVAADRNRRGSGPSMGSPS